MRQLQLLLSSVFFAYTRAQGALSLPSCGQVCYGSTSTEAVAAGCAVNNAQCYCTTGEFASKLNACAVETCIGPTSSSDIASVNAYANQFCSAATSSSSSGATSSSTTSSSTASSATASSATTSSTSSVAASSSSPSPTNSSPPSSGLSTGAKLGISLGSLIGAAAIGGFLFGFLCVRRRATKRVQEARMSTISRGFVEDAEFFAAGNTTARKEVERPESFEAVKDAEAANDKNQISELDGRDLRREEIVAPVPRRPLPAYELPSA